jgi:hypothetical protein
VTSVLTILCNSSARLCIREKPARGCDDAPRYAMARPADPTPACVAQQAAPAAPAAAPRRPPVDVGLLIQLLEPHEDFPTRVLEDIWHAIDGVTSCMPRRHKAFRWVCGHFGEAFLVWDEDDRDAVMAVLRAKLGDKLSWDDVKMTRRKYVAKLVRRYCPKPEVLRQRLEELWNTWHDCDDEEYGQLFNERAIVAWKLMLKRVDDGFYSDPDGLVLYIQVGVTEDGLPVYKCIRSTSDVEGGVHSVLRGAVITKGASVEHIEASLRNFTLRQSTNVRILLLLAQAAC